MIQPKSGDIRAFVAIELSQDILAALNRIQDTLKSADRNIAKWVDPRGIHLTLKFLGNIPVNQTESILFAVKKAASGVSPFSLAIAHPGAFPDLKRVRVVWVGLSGDLLVLQSLQGKVEQNLSTLGFPPEDRPFAPHLTLARVHPEADPVHKQALGRLISQTSVDTPVSMMARSISLMRSQLTPAGAIYSRIGQVVLEV
jgi:RNA 2',3'-cyclic 3'-phosphodiesterase